MTTTIRRYGRLLLAAALTLPAAAVAGAGPTSAGGIADPADGAALTVESMAAGRLDLFARGPDGALHQKVYTASPWNGWDDLGGGITSAPGAVSWGTNRLDVFARGANNTLVQKWYDGAWHGWVDLGGSITSAPAAASWGARRLDVFARGTNNALMQRFYDGAWRPWVNLGGSLTSAPAAASWGANRLDVFARGTSNQLLHFWYDGRWHNESLGGTLASAPAAVSWGSGRLDVFARSTSNTLLHWYFTSATSWRSETLPGTITSAPAAASRAANRLDVFGLDAAGDLVYRAWNGSAWSAWNRLAGFAPSVTVEPYARTSVVQTAPAAGATVGPLAYSYVDNIGRLLYGWQPDPDNPAGVQWTAEPSLEAFSGQPALVEQADGRAHLAALNTNGDVWLRTQSQPGATGWGPWSDAGGWVTSTSAPGRLPDGRLVLFSVDADGKLWAKAQAAANGAYGLWRDLGDVDLAGPVTAAPTRTGLRLLALDRAGVLRTATYEPTGALSAWSALSEAGMTGVPAVVTYPGFVLRVFVRDAAGGVVTKRQDGTGAFPAAWDPVGSPVAAGSPAAVISPRTGLTEVVVRGADGMVYNATETAQGSGAFTDWRPAVPTDIVAATDPTALTFTASAGPTWGFVIRTGDNVSYLFTRQPNGLAAAGRAGSGFAGRALPAPPPQVRR